MTSTYISNFLIMGQPIYPQYLKIPLHVHVAHKITRSTFNFSLSVARKPGLEVIKLFSCSATLTQLSMKFKLLINTEIAKSIEISGLNHQSHSHLSL